MFNSILKTDYCRNLFIFFIGVIFFGCESSPKNKFQRKLSINFSRLEISDNKSPNIVYSAKRDLDLDGLEDKIILFKNPDLKNKFDSRHFGLPMKIMKGTKDGFEEWKTNNKIIYSLQNNCVSEGFDNIVYRDNFFTIESQTCYDYNILVHGYITFKVAGDKIYLHQYGEEYFDKANHDKEIPTQIWTPKDFGRVNFEEVNEGFLVQLRIKTLTN